MDQLEEIGFYHSLFDKISHYFFSFNDY